MGLIRLCIWSPARLGRTFSAWIISLLTPESCFTAHKKHNRFARLMKRSFLLIAGAAVAASILGLGLFATAAQQWSHTATADHAEILSIETLPLEGLTLEQDEFLLLADTTPAEIESGHVAISVPCTDEESPEAEVDVVAGVAPDVTAVELEYVSDLSAPEDNRCTFHVTIPENDEEITDVAIINTGSDTVQFESGHFATISLTTARDGHDDEEDQEDAEDEDDSDTRTFTAELTGDEEVPEVDTDASGDAELEFEEGADGIEYFIDVQDIVDVTAAHIHMGADGENGDVVATLYSEDASGEIDGELASGDLVASDLEGPLEGQEIEDLVELIEDGEAYVNVHTVENPDGEIRGQLE